MSGTQRLQVPISEKVKSSAPGSQVLGLRLWGLIKIWASVERCEGPKDRDAKEVQNHLLQVQSLL